MGFVLHRDRTNEMKVIITLNEKDIDKLDILAKKLQDEGLIIKDLHPFGVITGRTDKQYLDKLKNHPEIKDFKEETIIRIDPPDSKIQ